MARQQTTWFYGNLLHRRNLVVATVEQSGVQVCAWNQLQGIVSASAGEQVR